MKQPTQTAPSSLAVRAAVLLATTAIGFSLAGCTGTTPTTSTAASSSTSPADADAVPSCALDSPSNTTLPTLTQLDYDPSAAIGQSEADVRTAVEAAGGTLRIVGRNGTCLSRSDDYASTRLNVIVDDGVVTWADFG
ncbi:MAG: hypothetical protein QM622_03280 [Microbacterium sp.]